MKNFLLLFIFRFTFSTFIELDNKLKGVPFTATINNDDDKVLLFTKGGSFCKIDKQGKVSDYEEDQESNIALNSKGIYINDNKILILSPSKPPSIYLYGKNQNKYNKQIPSDVNDLAEKTSFSFFQLKNDKNDKFLFVGPTDNGNVAFNKFTVQQDSIDFSKTLEMKSENSRAIKGASCEQYKNESTILCLFNLCDKEEKPYFEIKVLDLSSVFEEPLKNLSKESKGLERLTLAIPAVNPINNSVINQFDYGIKDIFGNIDKEGKLNVGFKTIEYSKLTKLSEKDFVISYFATGIFNFFHIKSEKGEIKLNQDSVNISGCVFSSNKTDVIAINSNTLAAICKIKSKFGSKNDKKKFKVIKIELKDDKMISFVTELTPDFLIETIHFAKFADNKYSLFYSKSNSENGFLICEEIRCDTEKLNKNVVEGKRNIDFSEFLLFSPVYYPNTWTIKFPAISKYYNFPKEIEKNKSLSFEFIFSSEESDKNNPDVITDSITYIISFGGGASDTCTVHITVESCYETCESCNEVGDENSHKCLKCKENYIMIDDDKKSCMSCEEINSNYYQNNFGFKKKLNQYEMDKIYECIKQVPDDTHRNNRDIDINNFCSLGSSLMCKNGCIIEFFNFYIDNNGKHQCTDKSCTKTGNTGKNLVYNDECVSECPKGYLQYQGKCEYIKSDAEDIKIDDVKDVMSKLKDYFLKGNNSTSFETDSMKIQLVFQGDSSEDKDTSSIDLAGCEKKLRDYYHLSPEVPLMIVKADIYRKDATIDQVEYSVYDDKGNFLNLSVCGDEAIEISYPIKKDANVNLELGKEMDSKGIDIYNTESPFFNDICFPFTKDGVDIVISDRRSDFYVNASFCETGCAYKGINYQTNKAKCSCSPKQDISKTVKENEQEELRAQNLFKSVTGSINIGILKCYKEFFKAKNLLNNVGFWFSLEVFSFELVLFSLFFKEFITWKKKITINSNSLEMSPRWAPPRSDTVSTGSEISEKLHAAKFVVNKRKRNPSIDSYTPKSTTKRTLMVEKNRKAVNKLENMPFYTIRDIDNSPYRLACKNDKRNCLSMLWKKIKEKQMFLRAIFVKSQFEFITINLSSYGSYFGLYFTLNALFYTNDLMSSRYKSGGTLSLVQELLRSGLSCLASVILFSFLKFSGFFSLAMDTIIFEVKMSKDFHKLAEKITRAVKFRVFLFFFIEMIFFLFILLYLSCFCIVYHSTQISWFKGGWMSFLISLGVCIGVCISFSLIRYISLRYKSRSLYNFQLFINRLY